MTQAAHALHSQTFSQVGQTHDPLASIAGQWRIIENAVLVPPTNEEGLPRCGVFEADGTPVLEGQCFMNGFSDPSTAPPPFEPPQDRLEGSFVFGGLLSWHFGHMLCESTPRLWAHPAFPEAKGQSVYFARSVDKGQNIVKMQRWFFEKLGLALPKMIVTPTQVARLIVPAQGMGTGSLMTATPEVRAYLRAQLAPPKGHVGTRKIYLTRARLARAKKGVIFGEEHVQAKFAAAGYEVIGPEAFDLHEQIALYRDASHIVGAESSALHLVSFCVPDTCKIGLLRRRNTAEFDLFAQSLSLFLGQDVVTAGKVLTVHSPVRLRRAVAEFLELSLVDMHQRMRAGGLLPEDSAPWAEMSEAERAEAMALLRARLPGGVP